MSDNTIDECFRKNTPRLKIDSSLVRRIIAFDQAFINRNDEHIRFFGGMTVGVHLITFSKEDYRDLFEVVFDIDDQLMRRELHNLKVIKPEHKVTSDVQNLTLAWLVHAFEKSKLPTTEKERAKISLLRIMHYRFVSSFLKNAFGKFRANPEKAEAAVASLDNKFSLKVAGSWYALLDSRAKEIVGFDLGPSDKKPLHYETIKNGRPDEDILYMISDIQTRIRAVMKKLISRYVDIVERGGRVSSQDNMVIIDGEAILRDRVRMQTEYVRYISDVAPSFSDFYKGELVDVIESEFSGIPRTAFVDTLKYLSNNFYNSRKDRIPKAFENLILHLFEYLGSSRSNARSIEEVPLLINNLKNVYMASRSTDDLLMGLREDFTYFAREATGIKTEANIAKIRTAAMVYVVLRTIAKSHYTGAKF